MTDEELKTQIALGLLKSDEIDALHIWAIKDPELLDKLAKIFYASLLQCKKDIVPDKNNNIWREYIPLQSCADRIHEEFLNNPNTNTQTRIYINQTINKLRKNYDK